MNNTPIDCESLTALAAQAAVAAGDVLLAMRGGALTVEMKGSATDPVSEADRAAQETIVSVIVSERPDDAFFGEESLSRSGNSGVRWIIDPLDGTVNYLHGSDQWGVSIAATIDSNTSSGAGQDAVVGVVHLPVLGRTYSAARGSGAWLREADGNGRALHVRDSSQLDRALIGTGFSYLPEGRRSQAATVAKLLPQIADIRRGGAAALDVCAVASGTIDAFFENDLQIWDWAAGALIATEAGAIVRDLPGPNGRSGIIASAPGLYDALAAAIS